MNALVTWFDPQPRPAELPVRLPSPFAPGAPHPLARRAAERLKDDLRGGQPYPPAAFEGANRGKMFGVLVVGDAGGRVGFLRGFSGTIGGRWELEGFVGPVFDAAQRDSFWPAAETELLAFEDRLRALTSGPEATALRETLAALDATHAAATAAFEARAAENRRGRHERRSRLADSGLPEAQQRPVLDALAGESLTEANARRRMRADQRRERETTLESLRALESRRAEIEAERAARSSELLEKIFDGYRIPNARGERRSLRALFAPATPPGGSGDCAAPKLFAHAFSAGLRPLALAEFWWGTPPATGGRRSGLYYPACRGKCGPVLAHMLDGLEGEPPPLFGADEVPPEQPRTVFEDRWIVVVDKPTGLLSVPGRSGVLRDSVLTRLQRRHPDASGPILVHRLDLDTSGLLLAAKDPATHAALQAQFCRREIEKRYVALLDGIVTAAEGEVDLALRVDVDDRPRQIHDPVHGRTALTAWRVIAREGGRTRIALHPRTGRTHQLRVHAAHPDGLGAPIVGDRLYGHPAERLMLHAEALAFVHPHTGERLSLASPAPF